MCDPITIGLAVAGGAVAAGGELYKGFAGQRANKLNAEIARVNADTLLRQAEIEKELADLPILKGAFEVQRLERAGERVLGAQFAGFQSGGFDPTYGSPMVLQGTTASQIKIDTGLIMAQAELEQAGALSKVARTTGAAAGQYGSAAGFEDRASDALIAGVIGAGASILKAGAQAWPGLGLSTGATPTATSSAGFTIE